MSAPPLAPGEPVVPQYDGASLGAVLPGVAVALGVPEEPTVDRPRLSIPPSENVIVVLLDGLGAELLAESVADAPFMTSLAADRAIPALPEVLRVGCPTTTATSMGSLGTGLPPGQHGIVGYEVRDPDRGVVLNHLRWSPYTSPVDWQPHTTVFAHCAASGVSVTNIGAAEFAGTGLTVAAHRGGSFVGVNRLTQRVNAALDAVRGGGRRLTYLYWGAIDAAGHERGCASTQWHQELRRTDRQLARLARGLPAGATMLITADHGMVDVPTSARLDIAEHPELREGVAVLAGEPRLVQLYCREGQAAAVARRFADVLGDRAWVRQRHEAVAEGWFGPVDDRVLPRIGDVLLAARGNHAVIDSGVASRKALALVGQHGSLTEAEQLVPLLAASR